MKRIIYFVSILFLCAGCEEFLNTQSYTDKNSQTFPLTEEDAAQLLIGVYAQLNAQCQGPSNDNILQVQSTYFYNAEIACDDRFGGGVVLVNRRAQAIGHLLYTDLEQFGDMWATHYTAIARANAALNALQNMPDGDVKNQKMGEAKFLRAFFYFNLVQTLGDVPLMTAPPENVQDAKQSPAQASQEAIYTQIATDLWEAYQEMPSYKWNEVISGTVTKWAAAGLLARVYLFYTGFYEKPNLPFDGGTISAQQAAAALKDCIDNSGHSLVPDFRSLWPYTNSLTKIDYPFAQDAREWVRDGLNPEQVFVIKFSTQANWNAVYYSNLYALYFSPQVSNADQYINIFPLGRGWAHGGVNPRMLEEWVESEPDDMRRAASIFNQADESSAYRWGESNIMEETGLWQKKIVITRAYGKGGDPNAYWNNFTSAPQYYDMPSDDPSINTAVDLTLIRYADILLMHSELTQTTDGMNAVRARVDLPPVAAYSLEAIQKERRHELAFEGLRWGDIRRWHIAEQVLGSMYGAPIYNQGVPTTMKQQGPASIVERYRATNGGFFFIPQREIDLSNGALKQNPGWGPDAIFNAWVDN